MIKAPLAQGQVEIVIGDRFAVKDDPFKFEVHIYLKRGDEMHGGVGETASEALFNAVAHWRAHEEKAE